MTRRHLPQHLAFTSMASSRRLNQVIAGLRYDDMQYDYDNNFRWWCRRRYTGVGRRLPPTRETKVDLQPGAETGATHEFNKVLSGFASYSNSFRTPSEGQVFSGRSRAPQSRAQAAAQSLLNLKPVIVDNYEWPARPRWRGQLRSVALLHEEEGRPSPIRIRLPTSAPSKRWRDAAQGRRVRPWRASAAVWRVDASLSYAKHTYETWKISGSTDYSGNEMESAPRLIANTRLSYSPRVT